MNRTHRRLTSGPSAEMDLRQCDAAERTQWIERYRRSGQSQRTFAATHGLKLSQLRYWIYSPAPKAEGRNTAPRLQEVHFNGWPAAGCWSAEIALPSGPTIRLDATLARVLIAPLLQVRV
jgi:hypothetical protein